MKLTIELDIDIETLARVTGSNLEHRTDIIEAVLHELAFVRGAGINTVGATPTSTPSPSSKPEAESEVPEVETRARSGSETEKTEEQREFEQRLDRLIKGAI